MMIKGLEISSFGRGRSGISEFATLRYSSKRYPKGH